MSPEREAKRIAHGPEPIAVRPAATVMLVRDA